MPQPMPETPADSAPIDEAPTAKDVAEDFAAQAQETLLEEGADGKIAEEHIAPSVELGTEETDPPTPYAVDIDSELPEELEPNLESESAVPPPPTDDELPKELTAKPPSVWTSALDKAKSFIKKKKKK